MPAVRLMRAGRIRQPPQNKTHNHKDETMTKTTQNPQENQDITYAVLEEIRNDISRQRELANKELQSLEYDCDISCNKAHKKIMGKAYAMGGDEYQTVTVYDSEGNADDYYTVYVEYKESVLVDVQCSVCGEIYTRDYPETSKG